MKVLLFPLILFYALFSDGKEEVMRKDGDTYIVNTTSLCDKKGYRGTTPLEVYIQDGRVVKIEALPNEESKGYFNPMTRRLFPLYENLKVRKARSLSKKSMVDAMTGATYSGRAVQANIQAALQYYKKNKS